MVLMLRYASFTLRALMQDNGPGDARRCMWRASTHVSTNIDMRPRAQHCIHRRTSTCIVWTKHTVTELSLAITENLPDTQRHVCCYYL